MSRSCTDNSLSIGRTSLVRLNRLAPAGGVENHPHLLLIHVPRRHPR